VVKGYLYPTDFRWYRYLESRGPLDEVNFWQPSGGSGFSAIPVGAPFLFKLKRPHDAVAGFGHFVRYDVLSAWEAWEFFGEKNGAATFEEMLTRIEGYRRTGRRDPSGSYEIGCIMIAQPVFFPEGRWVPQPRDWAPQAVRGAGYDLGSGEGARVWEGCRLHATTYSETEGARGDLHEDSAERWADPRMTVARLGQGIFRAAVLDAYGRACAVTTEHSRPVLEAAHIKPFAAGGEHRVSNGLLLRTDIHRLFDRGYVTVTRERRFEVSRR
jgi:putative restriction endonuclease